VTNAQHNSSATREALTAFIVRKEPKGHGTGQWIEGRALLVRGDPVAIVDDVVTTGSSTLQAIQRVREDGLVPAGAFALVDRNEGGAEAIKAEIFRLIDLELSPPSFRAASQLRTIAGEISRTPIPSNSFPIKVEKPSRSSR